MKSTILFPFCTAVVFATAVGAVTSAQAPTAATPDARSYPAPTNLMVLPDNLTGQQVHEIMEQWKAALGAHCNTCHVEDRASLGPDGRPRLNFADDSKEMKMTARTMYKMVEKINTDYVAKIDGAGLPVSCGTCHRGHLEPEPFVASPDAKK